MKRKPELILGIIALVFIFSYIPRGFFSSITSDSTPLDIPFSISMIVVAALALWGMIIRNKNSKKAAKLILILFQSTTGILQK